MANRRVLRDRARQLRRNQTDAERKLWTCLRNRRLNGVRFRRQHPVGPFIVDFCCPEHGIVVELDGSQHAAMLDADRSRTEFLVRNGYRVLRFWDNEVLNSRDSVLEAIAQAISYPHPNPLSKGEGVSP